MSAHSGADGWHKVSVMLAALATAALMASFQCRESLWILGKGSGKSMTIAALALGYVMYRRAGGRSKVLNLITGAAKPHIKTQLDAFTGIMATWRDDAGHGTASVISSANADEALRQLLHMCQWVSKEWAVLTE